MKIIIGKHIHSHWMGECGNGHTLSSSLHARNIQERLCKSHIVPFLFVINFFFLKFSHPSLQGVLHIREGGGSNEEDCQGFQIDFLFFSFSPKNTHTRHRGPKHYVLNKTIESYYGTPIDPIGLIFLLNWV